MCAHVPDLESAGVWARWAAERGAHSFTISGPADIKAGDLLDLGRDLLAGVEARHRLLVGHRAPRDPDRIATRHGPYVTCLGAGAGGG